MSSHEEGSGAASVPGGAVSTNETNNNIPEIVISVPHRYFNLSNVDIERLESLDKAFEGHHQLKPTTKPLIQRVPSTLGIPKSFIKYFKPRFTSIGPIHHGDPTLHGSEQLKLLLAAHFVKNIGVEKGVLYNMIKTEIGSLKKCYDPKVLEPYDDEKLAWMLFVDGCAILQAILQYLHYYECDGSKSWSKTIVKTDLQTFEYLDLFLLENQLPYRVLELLITSSSSSKGGLFMRLIERFIEANSVFIPEEMEEQLKQEGEPVHLLDHSQERKEDKPFGEIRVHVPGSVFHLRIRDWFFSSWVSSSERA
ncbi:Lycopene cyclase [Hibiscus syriacus]|uniref:Lycopene cyclase n=1 Tax=Hibiscus syriacus TaxID=106335 RepID=A0A6A2YR76_HIBSY|nr:Lycopene cyclase [Hibiscus syriacus]